MLDYGFFASIDRDREKTDAFLADFIAAIIGNGVYNGTFAVTADVGMQINVQPGQAWINGRYAKNPDVLALVLPTADGVLNRYDAIMLRCDLNERAFSVQVVSSELSESPTPPAPEWGPEIFERKLAHVYVPAGTVNVSSSNITDTRLIKDVCGIVTGVVDQVDTTTLFEKLYAELTVYEETADSTDAVRVLNTPEGKTWADYDQLLLTVKAFLSGHGGEVKLSVGGVQKPLVYTNPVTGEKSTSLPANWVAGDTVYQIVYSADGDVVSAVISAGSSGAHFMDRPPAANDDVSNGFQPGSEWFVCEEENGINRDNFIQSSKWSIAGAYGTTVTGHESGMSFIIGGGEKSEGNTATYGGGDEDILMAVAGHKYYLAMHTVTGNDNTRTLEAHYGFGSTDTAGLSWMDEARGTAELRRVVNDRAVLYEATAAVSLMPVMKLVYDRATTQPAWAQIDYPIIVDLTAVYGTGNEPTFAECQAMFAEYKEKWYSGVVMADGEAYKNVNATPGAAVWQRMVFADTLYKAMCNENVLHNWDFTNPVNQRRVSGTISTLGYFIDRWKLTSGTVTLTADGLVLDGTMVQILERAAGENVTASVKTASGEASATYDDATKTFTITSSGGTIVRAKLEMGEGSTIENDPPADYGAELIKCRRFLRVWGRDTARKVPSFSIFVNQQTTEGLIASCFFDTPMRIPPTVTNNDALAVRKVRGNTDESGYTFTFSATSPGHFGITAKGPFTLTDDYRIATTKTGGTLIASAEL